MSGRFVRASKFRHVHGEPNRKDRCYLLGTVKAAQVGDGNFIKGNQKYVAFVSSGGGGPVVVLKREELGRIDTDPFRVNLHKSPALDIDFSPFNDNMLAVAGEDLNIKLAVFNDDEVKPKGTHDEAAAVLEGHMKKIHFIHFHPTATNIISSASYDNTVRVWDVQQQKQLTQYEFADVPQSMEWNYDGSLIGTLCKDKNVRLFDPRAPDAALTAPAFQGAKAGRVAFLDNKGKFMATGFSSTSVRQYAIYDVKKFDAPMTTVDLDQSNGTLIIHYDYDTGVVFLAGKGDASIKYFEVVDDDPALYFLSEYRTNEAQKSAGFLPKRACDTKTCEIDIAMRLLPDGANAYIQPVSFQVPRKSEQFAEDLYPDTYAGIPVLSAEEYMAGKNAAPPTVSMKPGAAPAEASSKPSVAFTATKSVAQLEKELAAAHDRIKELEALVASLKH